MDGRMVESATNQPHFLVIPALRHVAAHWLLDVQCISAQLAGLEAAIESPPVGFKHEELDKPRKSAGLWRRNVGYYQIMLLEMAEELFETVRCGQYKDDAGTITVQRLRKDAEKAQRRMQDVAQRLERLQDIASSYVTIEESRMNSCTSRITLLATIFLPLNFATGFLSMSSNFSVNNYTF